MSITQDMRSAYVEQQGREIEMQASRRTALAMLGIAPVGIGTDAFAVDDHGVKLAGLGITPIETTVRALRRLIDAIEKDEVSLQTLDVNSRVEVDKFITHDLTIRFAYKA